MRLIEVKQIYSSSMPDGKVVILVKDSDGWWYILRYLFARDRTPFSSIEEIAAYLGFGDYSVVREFPIDMLLEHPMSN